MNQKLKALNAVEALDSALRGPSPINWMTIANKKQELTTAIELIDDSVKVHTVPLKLRNQFADTVIALQTANLQMTLERCKLEGPGSNKDMAKHIKIVQDAISEMSKKYLEVSAALNGTTA